MNIEFSKEDLAEVLKAAEFKHEPLEMEAKFYAKSHGLPESTVIALCEKGVYPAYKITAKGILKNKDDRGTWVINLVKHRDNLANNKN